MFRSSDDLFGLFSQLYMHDVRFSAFFLDSSTYPMVSPVWHSFVYRCFQQYCHLVTNLIRSQNSTKPNLSPFAGMFSKKISSS